MTKEERDKAIAHINDILTEATEDDYSVSYVTSEDAKWLGLAIEALERESCGDCVSRQAAIDHIRNMEEWHTGDAFNADRVIRHIKDLPPVTPQPKTGHWIEGRTNNAKIHNILCSRCFEGYSSRGHVRSQYTRKKYKYCPSCGAKMVEPQAEGSDKV